MAKKYIYVFLICLTVAIVTIPSVLTASSSNDNNCTYNIEAYQGLELSKLSQELENTGLIGRIHGAAKDSQMYVMSVREPNNFFSHQEFSLLASDSETLDILNNTHRHDRVCVRGNIIVNPSPQKHIAVNSVDIVESWTQPEGFAPYQREADFPIELENKTSFVGKVHAIGAEGKILVVEYKDGVIPIYVTATEQTKNLYRGDIVELFYQIQNYPSQPTHLQLDSTKENPIEVIDAISSWHNKPNTLTGKLVKFPRSPQLKFDVYAMEVETQGVKRYFTLINFQDMAEFENIRQKLAQIWDKNAATAVSGRNMLINPDVTIQAQGLTNIISPEQANPQILLESAAQVKQVNEK